MLPLYDDILSRIKEPPKWWDENGVPRFCDFHPEHAPNIYATEVALLEIACQACHERFLVELDWDVMKNVRGNGPVLSDVVRNKQIHYGDPPRHESEKCIAGNSMNCIDLRVVEFWKHGNRPNHRWVRVPELEIELDNMENWNAPF